MGMPSPGYSGQVFPQADLGGAADALRKAMKGFGTDEKAMIAVMSRIAPGQAASLRQVYRQRHSRDLIKDIESETSSYFREGLVALARGPLEQDVFNVHRSIKGMGTKEILLNDVLCGRSNADMTAIKTHFQHTYKKDMTKEVTDDLSAKTKEHFAMILAARRAEDSAPILRDEIERDVGDLYTATVAKSLGTDQLPVCSILSTRSDAQLRTIAQRFTERYHTTLDKVIGSEFSGHMKDTLLLQLNRAVDRAMTDAVQLEATMAGSGTKDDLLMNRAIRVYWQGPAHTDQVRRAYKHKYGGKELVNRVRGDTSGDQERLLVACLSQ